MPLPIIGQAKDPEEEFTPEPDPTWDGGWRLLSYNRLTGISTWHMYDHLTKETHIRECQEGGHIQAIIDHNHAMMNCGDNGWIDKSDIALKRVASVPLSELKKLRQKGINILSDEFEGERKKFLNDGDHAKFRTGPGRL